MVYLTIFRIKGKKFSTSDLVHVIYVSVQIFFKTNTFRSEIISILITLITLTKSRNIYILIRKNLNHGINIQICAHSCTNVDLINGNKHREWIYCHQ